MNFSAPVQRGFLIDMVFNNIFKYTLKYCLRQPLYFVVLVLSLILIGLFPLLSAFTFNEQIKMVFDSSMALILTFSFLLGILLSDGLIYREISTGNIMVLLSKPVEKQVLLLGKMAGLVFSLSIYILICCFASLISCYIAIDQFNLNFSIFYVYYILLFIASGFGMLKNFLYRTSFISVAVIIILLFLGLQFSYLYVKSPDFFINNGFELLTLIKAMFLLVPAVYIISAISIFVSTRFGLIVNMLICFSIFVLGLISDYLFGEYVRNQSIFFSFIYAVVPNWQFFWVTDAAVSSLNISFSYLLWCFAYSMFYVAFCSCLAFISLGKVELARRTVE